jgi:HK97 family phage major capsid protein
MEKQNEARAAVGEAQAIIDAADRAGRGLTIGERDIINDKLSKSTRLRTAAAMDDQLLKFGRNGGDPVSSYNGGGNIGARFVSSDGYQRIKSEDARGQNWSTGPVDVGYAFKGTMLENGGGTLVPPDYTGGIVRTNFSPVGLADYFTQISTTSNSVRYSLEGTATSGAAGVAEGAAKPESTLALSEVNEPVKKIATVLPISDELLEDAPAVQSYLNERLSLFVSLEEERQLLRGAGTNELVGIFGRSISSLGLGTAIANHVQLFKAAAGVRGSAFVDPNLIVMHPTNWATTRLATDSTGQYLGGGPWQGAYGQPQAVGASYFTSTPLWGMSVFVSPVVGLGTALVGNSTQAAAIYRRGGLSVEATNSHDDFFVRNMNMVRAEERLALALFRPSAWCQVTTLT